MRIVIIGAVAAGTSAAAKARRNSETASIVIYEKDAAISYSGCGMPYYLGGRVGDPDELTPRDPAFFSEKYNVDIHTGHEVLALEPGAKTLRVRDLASGREFLDTYDTLILGTGAVPFVPPIPGSNRNHVFVLRTIDDMNRIKKYLDSAKPRSALMVGTGFIGLEVCENLHGLGIGVTMVEKLPQVTPGLDSDMAVYVHEHLQRSGITVRTGTTVSDIRENEAVLEDGSVVEADLVLLAAGIRPNVTLAEQAGIELGVTGAIRVDSGMRTSMENIFACGDCIEHTHAVTGKPIFRPLGSTANKTGRIAGDQATGGKTQFRGVLGTAIFEVLGMTVAQTGLSEREALAEGYDVAVCHNIKPNKPLYMGGRELVIKGVADKTTERLLGVQIVGPEGVDKRIDVFATAIGLGAKVEDLIHLDLAYAPPFSTTKDPVMYTGMILDNAIRGKRPLMKAEELQKLIDSGEPYTLIDTRVQEQYAKSHVPTATNIPHAVFREAIADLDKEATTITYCNKGVTGNATQNILINRGFSKVYSLSGGHKHFAMLNKTNKTERGASDAEAVAEDNLS